MEPFGFIVLMGRARRYVLPGTEWHSSDWKKKIPAVAIFTEIGLLGKPRYINR